MRAVGYTQAGTVEFLLDPDSGQFYFIEVTPAHIIPPSTPDKTVQAGGKTAALAPAATARIAGN